MSTMNLIPYNSGLDMGTEYLTREAAYFLGNIYSSGESVTQNGKLYWIAPTRYNYGYATELEIEEHFEFIKKMSATMNAPTLMAENVRGTALDSGKFRLPGFGTFFRSTGLTDLNEAIPTLRAALDISPWSVKQAFMVGVFDGRGSIDVNKQTKAIRYIVLDCPTNEIGAFLYQFFEDNGFSCNYNESRDRKEGGTPRKPQLRIKNNEAFMDRIGFISPKRFSLVQSAYEQTHYFVKTKDSSDVLPGLKTITAR